MRYPEMPRKYVIILGITYSLRRVKKNCNFRAFLAILDEMAEEYNLSI